MASFTSILSDIGKGLKKFFTVATEVAQVAEPFVDVVLPGIAPLYNATLAAVVKAESSAIAAGSQNGTGAQKLALVVQSIETDFAAYATAQGISYNAATVQAWVSAVVATVNAIPANPTA